MIVPCNFGGGGASGSDECTATKAQVLSPYTAITSDSDDEAVAGTMTDNSGTTLAATASLDSTNSRYRLQVPNNAYYNTSAYLYSTYANTASALGLTAAKIATGNTILGIAGTYTGVGTATASQVLSGYTFSNSSSSGISGTMTDKSGSTTSATFSLDSSNSRVRVQIPTNGYYNTSAYLYNSYSNVASVIGLSADKMTTDKSCLGITGTQNYIYEYSGNPIVYSNTLTFTTSVQTIDSIFTNNDGGWIELMVYLTSDFDWVDGTYGFINLGKPSDQALALVPNNSSNGLFIWLYRTSNGIVSLNYYATSRTSNVAFAIREICYTNCDINSNW